MQVFQARSRTSGGIAVVPDVLSMYPTPPQGEVTLEEFEECAYDRLKVLRFLDDQIGRGESSKAYALKLKNILKTTDLEKNAQKDNVSHFIMRLAYCRNTDLRKQFLKLETALFRFRLDNAGDLARDRFAKSEKQAIKQVDRETLNQLRQERKLPSTGDKSSEEYYEVPFEEVLRLVQTRQVFLSGGQAFVPYSQLSEILASRFRVLLSRELAITYRATHNQRKDPRVEPMLAGLVTQYLGPSIKERADGSVTPAQIPMLSKRSFPLCMQNSYDHLRSDHHLKHGGRMHFQLFLKAIGLNLEDALNFWRSSFHPRTPAPKFDKQYAYTIRHNYGKVGKQVNYSPYSCLKIINHIPTGGDHCGCPFKLFGPDQLSAKLRHSGVSEQGIAEISEKAKGGNFQPACALYYHYMHPRSDKDSISIQHPNGYFEESTIYHKELNAPMATAGPGGKAMNQVSGPGSKAMNLGSGARYSGSGPNARVAPRFQMKNPVRTNQESKNPGSVKHVPQPRQNPGSGNSSPVTNIGSKKISLLPADKTQDSSAKKTSSEPKDKTPDSSANKPDSESTDKTQDSSAKKSDSPPEVSDVAMSSGDSPTEILPKSKSISDEIPKDADAMDTAA
eukprot:66368_1